MSNYFMKNGVFVVLLVLECVSSSNSVKAAALASPEPMPEVDEQSAIIVEHQMQFEKQAARETKLKGIVRLDLLSGKINSPFEIVCTFGGRGGGEYTYNYQWNSEARKLWIWNNYCSGFFYTLSDKELGIYRNAAIKEYQRLRASHATNSVALASFAALISALTTMLQN